MDCQLTPADCPSNKVVRLKCQEPFGEIESEGRNSQNWTCPRQVDHESGQLVHESFNISVGFCVHPGHVPNGHWDSNMTYFGSKITLICDEGYSSNGSATLRCVWLLGRSTYFPTWNVSIPFCWRSESITEGEGGLAYELTTLPETTATSFLTSEVPENNVDILAMAALLCVVPILVAILFMVLCRHHKKRRRSSQVSNQSIRQLEMLRIDNPNQNLSSTDHVVLNTTITDAGAEGHPSQNHHGNIFRDVTTQQENLYHIYQDAAEVDKGQSQPSNVQQVSLCAVSLESNVTSSVHASVYPCVYENHGVQETSLDQTASCYEDCEYQDVDLCGNDWLTKKGSRSFDEARLFDERCYNSLNVVKQSAQNIPSNTDNEYDHCNRSLLDKRLQSPPTGLSASGPSSHGEVHSDRNDDKSYSCVGSLPAFNRDDAFYYQLHPDEANSIETLNKPQFTDAFDSGEYCLLNPDKGSTHDKHPEKRNDILSDCYDSESSMSYVSNTRPCEELYATVNKTVGESSAAKPATCEELYATVNKTVGANSAAKSATCEELYATVNKTVGALSATKPATCEELYAKADKTVGESSAAKPATCEELYATVNKTVGVNSAAKPATCDELYATVNKAVRANSAAKPATCDELYAKVDKTKDGHFDNKSTSQEELYMNVTNTNTNVDL
ncbi:uncharacterized protein [Diadema antillarum]|uniref:uncharacterized protein isoform X2 n=1 Tax=Diadema antillarum TaxID=105358 RepID=UPI003A89C7B8